VFRVRRSGGDLERAGEGSPLPAPTRWSQANPLATSGSSSARAPEPDPRDRWIDGGRDRASAGSVPGQHLTAIEALARAAYVVGTFDTKGGELSYVARELRGAGLRVVTVDLSTSGRPSTADVGPKEVAYHHPR